LCKKLAKIADESDNWNEFIELTLMAYYIIKYSTIGVISFVLVYECEAVLLINEISSLMIKNHMFQIVKEVSYIKE